MAETMTTPQPAESSNTLTPADVTTLLISALRYAIGRRSYIVGETCRIATVLLPALTSGALEVMHRDICEAHSLGDKMDADEWHRLEDAIVSELETRTSDTPRQAHASPQTVDAVDPVERASAIEAPQADHARGQILSSYGLAPSLDTHVSPQTAAAGDPGEFLAVADKGVRLAPRSDNRASRHPLV